jgi:hypothetical protein
MKTKLLLFAVALLLAPAYAADRPFQSSEPVTLKPDQGYVLVRVMQGKRGIYTGSFSPILIRILNKEEIAAAGGHARNRDNVVIPSPSPPYARSKGGLVLLFPLKPGTYVLGGITGVGCDLWCSYLVVSSLCMGTVKFEVKPGVITDLGAVVNAMHELPTDIPELTKMVAGKAVDIQSEFHDVAVRPPGADTETPDGLKSLPIMPADYHAVGWLPNYFGSYFGRLAPLPGVLDYDKDGNVLDLKAQTKKP